METDSFRGFTMGFLIQKVALKRFKLDSDFQEIKEVLKGPLSNMDSCKNPKTSNHRFWRNWARGFTFQRNMVKYEPSYHSTFEPTFS